MTGHRTHVSLGWLADTVAALALLLVLAVAVLWVRSQSVAGDEATIDGPGTQFSFISRDGRLVFAVMEEKDPAVLWGWWNRGRRFNMNPLLNGRSDETPLGIAVSAEMLGWGVAAPHWVVAMGLMVIPAWWWVQSRHRAEESRRWTQGLCHECGYDLRASVGRCPECGAEAPKAAWGTIPLDDADACAMGGADPPRAGA